MAWSYCACAELSLNTSFDAGFRNAGPLELEGGLTEPNSQRGSLSAAARCTLPPCSGSRGSGPLSAPLCPACVLVTASMPSQPGPLAAAEYRRRVVRAGAPANVEGSGDWLSARLSAHLSTWRNRSLRFGPAYSAWEDICRRTEEWCDA
jgi:hypothetical protein